MVSGLVDFDDISYDDHADLLYDLATQTVDHFRGYLSEDDTGKVLRAYQRNIADFIHAQMQRHYWEDAAGYEVKISKGFTELKPSAYTHAVREAPISYSVSPSDKSNMAKYLFDGFARCPYSVQKFDLDAERKLAVILNATPSNGSSLPKGSSKSSTGKEAIIWSISRILSPKRRMRNILLNQRPAISQKRAPLALRRAGAGRPAARRADRGY